MILAWNGAHVTVMFVQIARRSYSSLELQNLGSSRNRLTVCRAYAKMYRG
jgi:hypothetical protein